jgi:hypothetical protein
MSDATLSSMEDDVLEGAVEATWAQWSALGAGALGTDRDVHSIVDPEALVLSDASATLRAGGQRSARNCSAYSGRRRC